MLDHPIARIEELRVEFQTKDGPVVGVENVSFSVQPGETVCIVGESGSGKSVSSLSLMRLVEFGGGSIARTEASSTSPRPVRMSCRISAATRSG